MFVTAIGKLPQLASPPRTKGRGDKVGLTRSKGGRRPPLIASLNCRKRSMRFPMYRRTLASSSPPSRVNFEAHLRESTASNIEAIADTLRALRPHLTGNIAADVADLLDNAERQ